MPAFDKQHSTRLEDLTHGLTQKSPIRQAVFAVETLDRSSSWYGAAGSHPEGDLVEPDTPFFIASIDKLLNATIVMKLSELGELDLDAAITEYLPPELTHGIHCVRGTDESGRITLRHLLSHTSGLADWLEDRPKGGRALIERLLKEGDMDLRIEDMLAVVREQLEPHFPPQDFSSRHVKVRYSDTNFMLLIAVIEAVTGKPLDQVSGQMLLEPLGMKGTYFVGRSEPETSARPSVLRSGGRPLQIPSLLRSVRCMYSTASDLLSFLRSLIRGELFKEATTFCSDAGELAPVWPSSRSCRVPGAKLANRVRPWDHAISANSRVLSVEAAASSGGPHRIHWLLAVLLSRLGPAYGRKRGRGLGWCIALPCGAHVAPAAQLA